MSDDFAGWVVIRRQWDGFCSLKVGRGDLKSGKEACMFLEPHCGHEPKCTFPTSQQCGLSDPEAVIAESSPRMRDSNDARIFQHIIHIGR